MTSVPARAAGFDAPAIRPWDRGSEAKPALGRSRPVLPAAKDSPLPAAPAFSSTVTRIDTPHPTTFVGSADIDRRLRVRRLKQVVALAAWLAIIAIIALILLIGSQPAATEFSSYQSLIT